MALRPSAPPAESRKTVTILFMDAVGSTGIGERSDPETLSRVMGSYFNEIRSVVERHGGVVEKYAGDAVMAVFGLPAVHEDDALRAVRAAAEIRTRLTELSPRLELERGMAVEWRTGINTGEVLAGDSSKGQRFVAGDAVNVAARLEQAAQPGEILLGSQTNDLVRGAALTESLAPITAKGKAQPLAAYRLTSVIAETTRDHGRLDTPMVGRVRQRRLLADAYDAVGDEGVCHLFTVLGAAGVGKSRLVREFVSDIADGALVLTGRCLSYGEGITYWPIADVIRQAARITENDEPDLIEAKLAQVIGDEPDGPKAVARLAELLGANEGSAGQEEIFWAVRTAIRSLCRTRPVVMILEDLHWAEPTLLDLVEHLTEWLREAPLLLICLARQELLETRPMWGGGGLYVTTINLEPLSAAESVELVGGLLGMAGLDEKLEGRIASAAEGNPLFVEEMVGMLIDGGQLVRRNGGWALQGDIGSIAVPPTIHALLAARLDGLPGSERSVLERGAVEGKVFHAGAVAELVPDAARDTVSPQLRSLSRKELVRPERPEFAGDEAFRFRHQLIRDAAYSSLPKEARADLHARFAGWLSRVAAERMAEYEEILAYHYQQAHRYRVELAITDEKTRSLARLAATHLLAAGQRALDRADANAALKLLTTASELAPSGEPLRTRVLAELAVALGMSADFAKAGEVVAQAIAAGEAISDEGGLAYAELVRLDTLGSRSAMPISEIVRGCERLLRVLQDFDDRRGVEKATSDLARYQFFAGRAAVAEEILERGRHGSDGSRRPVSYWMPMVLLWGPTPVAEAEPRVKAILEQAADRNVEGNAEAALGMLRALVGSFDEGREHVRRSIEIRRETGLFAAALGHQGNFLGLLELMAENYDEAERVLLESYSGLSAAGELGFSSSIAGHLADLYVLLERLDDAERFAAIAHETATADDVDAQVRAWGALARIAAARGNIETGLEIAGRATAMIDQTDYLELRADTHAHLAEVRLAAGDRAGARESLALALSLFQSKGVLVRSKRVEERLQRLEV